MMPYSPLSLWTFMLCSALAIGAHMLVGATRPPDPARTPRR